MRPSRWLVLLALFNMACGPAFVHEPLIGEDKPVLDLIGAKESDLVKSPMVVAAERLHRALQTRQSAIAWSLLTRDSQAALTSVARHATTSPSSRVATTPGQTVLATGMWPPDEKHERTKPLHVNLVALYMVTRPTRFRSITNNKPGDTTGVVEVLNRAGKSRRLDMRLEEGAWKLHHTSFKNLPSLPVISPSKVPHERIVKTPKVQEKPPATEGKRVRTPPGIATEKAAPTPPKTSSEQKPSTKADDPEKSEEPTEPKKTSPASPRPNSDLDF